MNKRAIQFGGMVIVLIVGFLLGWSVQAPTLQQPLISAKVEQKIAHLMIDEGDGQIQSFPSEQFFAGQTVFDILKNVTTRVSMPFVYDPPGSYGVFIRQIGAKKNGLEKKYWQYWVNGRYAMIAADKTVVSSGDTILWKFTIEQQYDNGNQ